MNLTRKIQLATQSIESISRHDDEDSTVRSAALDRLSQVIATERDGIAARLRAKVATVGPVDAPKT